MTQEDNWNNAIATIIKMNIDQMILTENQKEARKEFADATKELFVNRDEKKASVHFARLIEYLLSNRWV